MNDGMEVTDISHAKILLLLLIPTEGGSANY